MSTITPKDRVAPGNRVTVDLAKQDYAVKLGGPGTEFVGFIFNLDEMKARVLGIPSNGHRGGNAAGTKDKITKLIANLPNRLNMYDVLTHTIDSTQVLTELPEDTADVTTIGTDSTATINVNTQRELINSIVF